MPKKAKAKKAPKRAIAKKPKPAPTRRKKMSREKETTDTEKFNRCLDALDTIGNNLDRIANVLEDNNIPLEESDPDLAPVVVHEADPPKPVPNPAVIPLEPDPAPGGNLRADHVPDPANNAAILAANPKNDPSTVYLVDAATGKATRAATPAEQAEALPNGGRVLVGGTLYTVAALTVTPEPTDNKVKLRDSKDANPMVYRADNDVLLGPANAEQIEQASVNGGRILVDDTACIVK